MHYEVELGLVIKTPNKPLKNLPDHPSLTHDIISQYLIGIDMTARNVQDEAKRKSLPWSIAKGFDTFLPISNAIPAAALPDPHGANVVLSLSVNGVRRQHDSTALMLFRIPRLLSEISKVMSLEDGDVVLTGTPKGVGPVGAGDVMTAGIEVDGIELEEGRIEVAVVDADGGENAYRYEET
jgi:acylpyruvate hydrolase